MSACPPTWVRDAVFYQIFPDRFARSPQLAKPSYLEPWDTPPTVRGFKGGDLLGVKEHLDYLEDLGVNALYFNPIFQSTANHRYHTHDYFHVDPILGGNAAFRALRDAAHARGIRIILDGVFNHVGRGFLQFNHLLENGRYSPYLDWFLVTGFPLHAYNGKPPNYECWWGNRELPKLNTDNAQVRDFLFAVAEHWLHQGIDGWRLDVPLEIRTPGFWEEFRRRVKKINPEAYILAEIWDDASPWLEGDHFDAVMNYPFNRACLGFFGGRALDVEARPGGFPLVRLDAQEFAHQVSILLNRYSLEVTQAQFNLLSSHDEPRFLTLVGEDPRRLQLATLFQMTFPGAPNIYYGDEIGMRGGADPDCRRSFPWDESRWQHSLRAAFRRYIALRKAHPALRHGRYITLYARGEVYAFVRQTEEETLIIALNAGEEAAVISLALQGVTSLPVTLTELWSETLLKSAEGRLPLRLPPLAGKVFLVS
ncbi:MAG: glycoside hydrolase family 13 protein [Anaerolineae bacterium]